MPNKIKLKPFDANDWEAYLGCESKTPFIANLRLSSSTYQTMIIDDDYLTLETYDDAKKDGLSK